MEYVMRCIMGNKVKNFPMGSVETDKDDISYHHSWAQFVARTYVVKESKLVEMVDELDLWTDVEGSLEVNG